MHRNIFSEFELRIKDLLQTLKLKKKTNFSRIKVEMPNDPLHGDLSSNAAMLLAKDMGENPCVLAEHISSLLRSDPDILDVRVADPGFINIWLKNDFWLERLTDLIKQGGDFGRSDIGKNIKINVEYVSANPTGPLHVGHCRGAVVGDVVANLLSFCGYDVVREYYVNDSGGQIENLSRSVFLRYRQILGEKIDEIQEGLYPGEYLIPLAKALVEEFSDRLLRIDENETIKLIGERAVSDIMHSIREDLSALNVYHDVFFSEKILHADNATPIRKAIEDLTLCGYIYKGKLPPPKGQNAVKQEDREQILLRSTQVGDDIDRPLVKSDGSYTYFAADIAYFKNKYERGFSEMIYILGADHGGYVKRLEAMSKAISKGEVRLKTLLCQLVRLYRQGEPVRMGKRTGTFVTLRDVIEEVGCDPVRFMMLYRKSDVSLDFDFAKVLEQSKDNPVFYVQYATARCHSIFRQACEVFHKNIPDKKSLLDYRNRLIHESEFTLIRKLVVYPYLIEQAARNLEPHRLVFYLYDLAAVFHSHWNKGNEETSLRFIQPSDETLTFARLGLVQAVANVLTSGLTLVGVTAPKSMHS